MVADDHAVVREGLRKMIERDPQLTLVAETEAGLPAVETALEVNPDIVVIDLRMLALGAAEAARRIREARPAIRLLAFTAHGDFEQLRRFLRAGGAGFLPKRAAAAEVLRALRTVARGDTYIPSELPPGFLAPAAPLSEDQEVEHEDVVMRLLAWGYTNKEIARRLEVSVKTVDTYKRRAMGKFGLRSRVEVMKAAAERGWLIGEPPGGW